MRLLHGEGVAHEVVEAVVRALMVEGLVRRPRLLDDLDGLTGARVPLVLGEEIALALLLVVIAAGDEVDGEAAVADPVQRGEGLGRERRVRDVGAVGDQDLERLGAGRDVGGGRGRVGEPEP